jgi:hypothetical protein
MKSSAIALRLVRDGLHDRERILDAMRKLAQRQLLALLEGVALGDVMRAFQGAQARVEKQRAEVGRHHQVLQVAARARLRQA